MTVYNDRVAVKPEYKAEYNPEPEYGPKIKPKIKLCGLTRPCDVDYVNQALPDYAGFVLAPGKRQVTEETAAMLSERLLPDILPVGVFKDAEWEVVQRLSETGRIRVIQLHGRESPDELFRIKEALPEITVIKAISVGDREQESLMKFYQEAGADYFLFDHGGGGTGQTFDWQHLPVSELPFFIAGGLCADNIRQAIQLRPYGIDISSGIETDGKKDRSKILEIMSLAALNCMPPDR